MRINREHKFIYISTPKNCTHSMYSILRQYYSRGLSENGFHNVKVPPEYRHYFKWTICRNPFTRAVSLWWSGCRLHPPDRYGFRRGCGASDNFTQFIVWLSRIPVSERKEILTRTQKHWLQPCEPVTAIQMERMSIELPKLKFWKPVIEIPQMNTTMEKIAAESKAEGKQIERPPWNELYNDKARDAVLRWAGEDFERFGYSTKLEDAL